ncbi:MAG: hypothetical protein HQL73_03175 [Magnetococcales bacterium]|nr:hypothetical protein [Magnetococcales bacterium]
MIASNGFARIFFRLPAIDPSPSRGDQTLAATPWPVTALQSWSWLLIMVCGVLLLSGCKEITSSDLEIRSGVAYLKDGTTPYSGPIKDYYKNQDGSNGKLLQEGSYNRGLKHDVWTTYKWNGEKSVVKFEAGLEEGSAEEYYPDGAIKRQVGYSKGKLNGFSSEYDTKGKVGRQIYYTNGFISHPPSPRKGESKSEEGGAVEESGPTTIEEKLYGKRKKSMMEYIKEMF